MAALSRLRGCPVCLVTSPDKSLPYHASSLLLLAAADTAYAGAPEPVVGSDNTVALQVRVRPPWAGNPSLRAVNPPPWAMDPPPRAVNPPPWAVNPPPWAVSPRPWAVNPPPWTVNPPSVTVVSPLTSDMGVALQVDLRPWAGNPPR
eukprot:160622-Prorocentrum_minimum.AAC.1